MLDTLAGHSCLTPFARHSFLTLLLVTLSGHSSLTLLQGHSCGTLLRGHSCWTFLLDTLAGHSLLTLLLDTLDTTFLLDTLAGHSYLTASKKQAFPTRLSPKVTIQASKTSVFHETFTKSDNPKLPKRAFYTRLSPKVTIQASKTSVLHETSRKSELRSNHSASQIPMEQRDLAPRKHHSETANPNITATQTSHFHETRRLCSEITVFNLQVYDVLRLPRKMTFVTFLKTSKIVTLPSVWNDFDHFHSHTLSSKSTFYLRLVTKTELFKPPCNCKSQWNSAIQHL